MNETIRTLLTRRSVRCYTAEQVGETELNAIVEAGIWAPSGMNRQSVRLAVLRSGEVKDRLVQIADGYPNRGGNPFYGAPVIVIAFADMTAVTPVQDASLALGNIMNAAASLGISSCWINCVKDLFLTSNGKVLKEQLCPGENYAAIGSASLGYAKETPEPKPRLENRVSYF